MRWPGHRFAAVMFSAVIAVWLAVMAVLMRQSALPAEATGPMLVVFEPGTPDDRIFASLVNAGARPVRSTAFSFIWVVTDDAPGLAGRLADQGAIGAYAELPLNPSLAGCFALADAKVSGLLSARL